MATYDASVKKALIPSQQDLIDHKEHCSADPVKLATVGRERGHQATPTLAQGVHFEGRGFGVDVGRPYHRYHRGYRDDYAWDRGRGHCRTVTIERDNEHTHGCEAKLGCVPSLAGAAVGRTGGSGLVLRWLPSFFVGCALASILDRAARSLTVARIPRCRFHGRDADFTVASLQVRWHALTR
jgi:hypothetical protein